MMESHGCAWVVLDAEGRVWATTVHRVKAAQKHNPVAPPDGGQARCCTEEAGDRVVLGQRCWALAQPPLDRIRIGPWFIDGYIVADHLAEVLDQLRQISLTPDMQELCHDIDEIILSRCDATYPERTILVAADEWLDHGPI